VVVCGELKSSEHCRSQKMAPAKHWCRGLV
jgi:hypothetical protein